MTLAFGFYFVLQWKSRKSWFESIPNMVEVAVAMLDIDTIVGHEGSLRDGNMYLYIVMK